MQKCIQKLSITPQPGGETADVPGTKTSAFQHHKNPYSVQCLFICDRFPWTRRPSSGIEKSPLGDSELSNGPLVLKFANLQRSKWSGKVRCRGHSVSMNKRSDVTQGVSAVMQGMRLAGMGGTAAVLCVLYRSAEVSWCDVIVRQQICLWRRAYQWVLCRKWYMAEYKHLVSFALTAYAFSNLLRRGSVYLKA